MVRSIWLSKNDYELIKKRSDKMKKNYIQPEITASVRYSMECPLCVSIQRAGQWGNSETTEYSNGAWFNEGYTNKSSDAIVIAGDDAGSIDSQTKGRGGDWGSIW